MYDPDHLQELRTATNLGNFVMVDNVMSSQGEQKLVGAGPIVLDRNAFVYFWFSVMLGAQPYRKIIDDDDQFVARLIEMNKELVGPLLDSDSNAVNSQVIDRCNRVLRQRFFKISVEEKYEIMKNILNEFDN